MNQTLNNLQFLQPVKILGAENLKENIGIPYLEIGEHGELAPRIFFKDGLKVPLDKLQGCRFEIPGADIEPVEGIPASPLEQLAAELAAENTDPDIDVWISYGEAKAFGGVLTLQDHLTGAVSCFWVSLKEGLTSSSRNEFGAAFNEEHLESFAQVKEAAKRFLSRDVAVTRTFALFNFIETFQMGKLYPQEALKKRSPYGFPRAAVRDLRALVRIEEVFNASAEEMLSGDSVTEKELGEHFLELLKTDDFVFKFPRQLIDMWFDDSRDFRRCLSAEVTHDLFSSIKWGDEECAWSIQEMIVDEIETLLNDEVKAEINRLIPHIGNVIPSLTDKKRYTYGN